MFALRAAFHACLSSCSDCSTYAPDKSHYFESRKTQIPWIGAQGQDSDDLRFWDLQSISVVSTQLTCGFDVRLPVPSGGGTLGMWLGKPCGGAAPGGRGGWWPGGGATPPIQGGWKGGGIVDIGGGWPGNLGGLFCIHWNILLPPASGINKDISATKKFDIKIWDEQSQNWSF